MEVKEQRHLRNRDFEEKHIVWEAGRIVEMVAFEVVKVGVVLHRSLRGYIELEGVDSFRLSM